MSKSASNCSSCGAPIEGENPNGAPEQQKPCPRCGSVARTIALQASGSVRSSGSAQLTVVTYPEVLLRTAKDLLSRNEFGIATVVSHMACEVATERVLSQSFAHNGISNMEEAVLGFLNGYNLASSRNLKLYVALTGDDIQQRPFWQAFKDSATRRNAVIHKGAILGRSEAEASLSATAEFVSHLGRQ